MEVSFEARDFCLFQNVQTGSGINPVGGALWAELKRPGHEFDHLTPCIAEVKNEWSYAAVPPVCLHGVGREKFAFLLCF
jgi:hypothetical protein